MAMLLQVDWEHVAERWGLPVVVIIGLVLAIIYAVRKLTPIITRYFEKAEQDRDTARSVLSDQIVREVKMRERVENMQETLLKDFKASIDESNRLSRRLVEGMDETLSELRRSKHA